DVRSGDRGERGRRHARHARHHRQHPESGRTAVDCRFAGDLPRRDDAVVRRPADHGRDARYRTGRTRRRAAPRLPHERPGLHPVPAAGDVPRRAAVEPEGPGNQQRRPSLRLQRARRDRLRPRRRSGRLGEVAENYGRAVARTSVRLDVADQMTASPRRTGLIASGRHRTARLVIVGVAVLGVGLIVVRDLRSSNRQARTMYENSMAGLDLLNELQYLTQEARRSVLYALGTSDVNRQVEYADQSRAADAEVAGIITRHIAGTPSSSALQAANRFAEDWRAYLTVRDRVISAILEGSNKEATDID